MFDFVTTIAVFVGILLIVEYNGQSRLRSELARLRAELKELQEKVSWLVSAVWQADSQPQPGGQQPRGTQPEEAPGAPVDEPVQAPAAPQVRWGTVAPRERLKEDPGWICASCHRKNRSVSGYCIHCGSLKAESADQERPLVSVAPEPEPAAPPIPPAGDGPGTLEQRIGQNWMTWTGALFIIVAVGAAVKVMFDMGLFSPLWRLVLECALGLMILQAGRYLLGQKMPVLGHGLMGVGLAVFYVSLYAAYSLHNLMSPALTLLCVALVTAGGMLVALRYQTVAIATLAIIGGLITPLMVSQGDDIQHVLFSYVLVLDLGVLFVALSRRWRTLDLTAYAGTVLLVANWSAVHYTPVLLVPTMLWLGAFFVLFMLVPFVNSMRSGEPLSVERFVVAMINATVMIFASWYFLGPVSHTALGLVALAMSLCYLVLAVACRQRIPEDRRSHQGQLALAISFLTLAVPLLLEFNAVIITWAVEAPLLAWLGLRFASRHVRNWTIPVLALALLWYLFSHLFKDAAPKAIFFNPGFGTAICIPLGAFLAAWIHHWLRNLAEPYDRTNKTALAIGGGLLALLLVNHEVSAWFARLEAVTGLDQGYANLALQLLVWTTGLGLFMVAGICWSSRAARLTAKWLIALSVVVGCWSYLGLIDSGPELHGGYLLFWNLRFSAALFLVLVLFMLAWLHATLADRLPEDESRQPVYLAILGGLLLTILLAGDISFWFSFHDLVARPWLHPLSLGWQTLVWAAGSAGFLLAGLHWRCREALWAGAVPLSFGLLAGAGAYFAQDEIHAVSSSAGWLVLNLRFLCALALVLALFAYGLFIRRARTRFEAEDQQLATAAYVTADFALLALLSAEVTWFFHSAGLPGLKAHNWANVALSIVWGIYALAFITAGFYFKKPLMRMWAMGLLGTTAVKIVVFDLHHLPPASRLLSLLVIGLVMLTTAYLYHRAEMIVKTEQALKAARLPEPTE